MSVVSFALAVIFIIRLFSTSVFRVPKQMSCLWELRSGSSDFLRANGSYCESKKYEPTHLQAYRTISYCFSIRMPTHPFPTAGSGTACKTTDISLVHMIFVFFYTVGWRPFQHDITTVPPFLRWGISSPITGKVYSKYESLHLTVDVEIWLYLGCSSTISCNSFQYFTRSFFNVCSGFLTRTPRK